MKKTGLMMILALSAACVLYVYTAGAAASESAVVLAASEVGPPRSAEAARIQAHLAAVERELLARDVSHLSEAQRAARALHIQALREYREAGVFPHNHDFPGERVPYFVDEHGTLCAMAYLIARSGHQEMVERVASTRNNARVRELADDPELVAWLEEAGLSAEEAARIQPWYGHYPPQPEPDGVRSRYAVASALTSAVGGLSAGMNLVSIRSGDGPRWPGILGIAAGAAGLALGLDGLDEGGATATVGAVNAGVGVLSLALGSWNLLRLPGDRADADPAVGETSPTPSVTATPLLTTTGDGGLGLMMRVRF